MKTILLMRHAKSTWKGHTLVDLERPLNERGALNARRAAEMLCARELVPQLILCSHAVRARQTAELVAEGTGYEGSIQTLNSFYMAEPEIYLGALSILPDELERVLIVGHNPGLEGLVQQFSKQIISLPTASVAYMALPLRSWRELNPEVEGELLELIVPEKLEQNPPKEVLDLKDTRKDGKKRGSKSVKKCKK
jgi:phosphohistidine phosphatase